jgi:hypothetical protein
MQNDYYVLAHEQAAKERAELRAQIEKLLARDSKLEKLVDCLKEFLPVAEGVGSNGHQPPTDISQSQYHTQEHQPVPEHAGA